MRDIPDPIRDFWSIFAEQAGTEVDSRFYEAFHFVDNEAGANQLADLVLAGTKRATAGLFWAFEAENDLPPKPGDLSVVTDWHGHPLCVIETRQVEIIPFDEVSEDFAATEGEGDKSLNYWRKAHWDYFVKECSQIGKVPDLKMPVICERFDVVFPIMHKS